MRQSITLDRVCVALVVVAGFLAAATGFSRHAQARGGIARLDNAAYFACSKWWLWTDDAPHQAAIVQVRQGQAGGTGTLVWASEDWTVGVVATASHVVEGNSSVVITWPMHAGYKSAGRVVERSHAADMAFVEIDPPDNTAVIPLATEPPKPEDWVEILGWGGPSNDLRHFKAKVKDGTSEERVIVDTSVISGDSGGAILNGDKELVAVIYGGRHRQRVGLKDARGNDWSLVYPTAGYSTGPLRRMWNNWRDRRQARRGGGSGGYGGYDGTAPPAAPLEGQTAPVCPDGTCPTPADPMAANPPAPVETPDIAVQPAQPVPQPEIRPAPGEVEIDVPQLVQAVADEVLAQLEPRLKSTEDAVAAQGATLQGATDSLRLDKDELVDAVTGRLMGDPLFIQAVAAQVPPVDIDQVTDAVVVRIRPQLVEEVIDDRTVWSFVMIRK